MVHRPRSSRRRQLAHDTADSPRACHHRVPSSGVLSLRISGCRLCSGLPNLTAAAACCSPVHLVVVPLTGLYNQIRPFRSVPSPSLTCRFSAHTYTRPTRPSHTHTHILPNSNLACPQQPLLSASSARHRSCAPNHLTRSCRWPPFPLRLIRISTGPATKRSIACKLPRRRSPPDHPHSPCARRFRPARTVKHRTPQLSLACRVQQREYITCAPFLLLPCRPVSIVWTYLRFFRAPWRLSGRLAAPSHPSGRRCLIECTAPVLSCAVPCRAVT